MTSAGAGPSVGKHLLMAYLPPEHAVVGEQLAVEYLNERYPVTVAIAGPTPIFDPENTRIRLVNILVCAKRVPMTGGTIVLTADEQAIETRHLGFTISPHEECGVEEAVRLIEAHGGESVVLTLGRPRPRSSCATRWRLASTARSCCWPTRSTTARPRPRAIVEAIQAERTAGIEYDLIFFGNESADSGNYQVGIRVAHALGWPCVTGIKGITVADGGRARWSRRRRAGAMSTTSRCRRS